MVYISGKLITIDNLVSFKSINREKQFPINSVILKALASCIIFYTFRAIFILPIFIFSKSQESFINLFLQRYTYGSPSYEKIWENFKECYFWVFGDGDFLIKYIVVSFVLLSIILVYLIKSPSGILISFIVSVISPYIIDNIFIPILSIAYVPINYISLFIDNLIPALPVTLVWALGGVLLGTIYAIREKRKTSKIFLIALLAVIFIITQISSPLEGVMQLKNLY